MIYKPRIAIGIEHIEWYVPVSRGSVAECLRRQEAVLSAESFESYWHDTVIETERLMEYFARQISAGGDAGDWGREQMSVEDFRSAGLEFAHCATEESSSDMAVKVGRLLLQRNPELARKTQLLIHAHSTLNESPTWSTPCRLQHELKLNNAVSFSVSQKGGNSTLTSLNIACSLITAENELDTVIVIASDKIVPPCRRALPGPTLLSDGAGALVLRRSDCGIQFIGSHVRDFSEVWTPHGRTGESQANFVDFVACQARNLLKELLQELGLRMNEVSLIIPPNLNVFLAPRIAEECSVPLDTLLVSNVSCCGNLGSAELIVNLARAAEEREFKPQDVIVVLSLGYGLSLGCAALKWGAGLTLGRETSYAGISAAIA